MTNPPPIYKPPAQPLTAEDVQSMIDQRVAGIVASSIVETVQGMIDRAIAAHTQEGLLASAGGALVLGAMVWAMSAR